MEKFLWLNIYQMLELLLKPGQRLVEAKYFTSPPRDDLAKQKRFKTYIDALQTTPIQIFYGRYQKGSVICPNCGHKGWMQCANCGHQWPRYVEKMTDVKLATELVQDGLLGSFDVALLLTADADLSSPVQAVLSHDSAKKVIAIFPPKRRSAQLKAVVSGQIILSRSLLAKSQFPDRLKRADGFVLERPKRWL